MIAWSSTNLIQFENALFCRNTFQLCFVTLVNFKGKQDRGLWDQSCSEFCFVIVQHLGSEAYW